MMSNPPVPKDLIILAKNITSWRKNKRYLRERMPKVLKADVLRLCQKYGVKHVCKHTELNNPIDLEEQVRQKKSKEKTKRKFVPISADEKLGHLVSSVLDSKKPQSTQSAQDKTGDLIIEVKTPDGICVSFRNHSPAIVLRSLKEAGLC